MHMVLLTQVYLELDPPKTAVKHLIQKPSFSFIVKPAKHFLEALSIY